MKTNKFNLIKYYDTSCDFCGNWATHYYSASDIGSTQKSSEKFLKKNGWKVVNNQVLCYNCVNKLKKEQHK